MSNLISNSALIPQKLPIDESRGASISKNIPTIPSAIATIKNVGIERKGDVPSAKSLSPLSGCGPEKAKVDLPFFSDIQRYAPRTANIPLSIFFNAWFIDLKQIYALIQSYKPSTEIQRKLLFYLAHRYHYNAPFSQEENKRLGYQTSPLAITERNSYLRSSQTIWMRLASQLVYQQLGTTEEATSIIWIDHINFVFFLRQFYQVEEVSDLTLDTRQAILQRWRDNYKEPLQPFYIFLKNVPGNPKARLEKAKKFAEETLKEITEKLIDIENRQSLDAYFSQVSLPESLRKAGLQILGKGGLKNTSQYNTEETLHFLKKHYGQQLSEKYQKYHIEIQKSYENGDWKKEQAQFLFSLYKRYPDSFASIPAFKIPTDILDFLRDKNASSAFINQILALLSAHDFLKFKDYIEAFQKDVHDNIPKRKQKAEDIVGIFYADSFEGLHALISPHGGDSIVDLVKILGNLGYSPNAVHFLQALLQGYPSFFPTQKQASFLEAAIKTKILSLPKKLKEVQEIACSALANLNTINNSMNSLSFENIYSDFVSTLSDLKKMASKGNTKDWLKLYIHFLIDLLNPITKRKKDLNESTLFAIKKITDSIKASLRHKNNIHLFIRDIQNVLEAWMLYIDINPLVTDPAQVFRNALPSKPTVVHFTSYAMRSFTRVLQALAPMYSSKKMSRLRIQVFNQSYFELINNMEKFRKNADVLISQSDAQIEDCDVYFIDIHPNNAVEARLFSHNLPEIIKALKTFPQNRLRTLVVDITLSSLSDPEVIELLKEASPLIQSGQLNLVLIQSLTKFSQLGLDKLSAGFLAAYNNTNQRDWKIFNDQLDILQTQEPVDSLTLQFFACLIRFTPRFQKNYIRQINENTKTLYHKVLEKYQTLNLPISKRILALTCNTDLHTCYLAFDSRGIFSLLDPFFNLSVNEISCFTKDLIKGLFIPLAEWLGLPLTERMSVGFPLSSINECMHAIRLTVGLERDLLDKYADMIAYICFIMNRTYQPELFFELGQAQSKGPYPKRDEYLKEKVEIFKAMYPVHGKRADPVRIKEPVEDRKNAEREFVLDKGTIQVIYHTEQSRYRGPVQRWDQTLKEEKLYVHIGPSPSIPLTDKKITPFIKCLLASCLAQRQRSQNGSMKNEHNIKFTATQKFENGLILIDYLIFSAFHYIRKDNIAWNRYGYYNLSYKGFSYQLSFDFKDGKLWLVLNENWFDESTIFIRKGHEVLPATLLDTEEKWQLFDQASYVQSCELPFTGHRYKPDRNDPTTVILEFRNCVPFVIIERDKLAFKVEGLSLYCRKRTKDIIQLEIDFWGIKNPIHARFLCLFFCYVAFYRKEIPFEFVSESYGKVTLLQKDYDLEKLKEVAREILDHREKILFQFDKKRPIQKEVPVQTNPHPYNHSSEFHIFGSVIPYPNFMETIFSRQIEIIKWETEFKKYSAFRDFLSLGSTEQANALERDFACYRLFDAVKAKGCFEKIKHLVIQEIRSKNYLELMKTRNLFMRKSDMYQEWNKVFANFVQIWDMPATSFSADEALAVTMQLNELFEKELTITAENFIHPEVSTRYALLNPRDQLRFSKLIVKLQSEGKLIQRTDKERQILQTIIICITDVLKASKVEKSELLSEVLELLKKRGDVIESLTISGYPVVTYIEQYFNFCQQITHAIIKAFSALALEGVNLEHAISLVGAGRTNAFLGMEQILKGLDLSLFCQPIPDADIRRRLMNALCQVDWSRLIMPQILEITKDIAVQSQVQTLIDKVILELQLHLYQIKLHNLVELDNPGSGDCLVYSYLNSHYVQNVQPLQKSNTPYKATAKEVLELRARMAKEITDHVDEFEVIIDRFLSDQFMAFVSKKLGVDAIRSATIDVDFQELLSPYFTKLEGLLRDLDRKRDSKNTLDWRMGYEELIQKWRTTEVFRTLAKDYAEQIVSKQGKYLTSPAIEALARVTKNPIIVEKDGVFLPFGIVYDAPPLYIRDKGESYFVSLVLRKFVETIDMGGSVSFGHHNTSASMHDLDSIKLGEASDSSAFVVHPHAGLENYNLVCYANAALQSLTSRHFITQLERIQKSYESLPPQSQSRLQSNRMIFEGSGFKGQLHEFLTSICGHLHGALSLLKSGEETKRAGAIQTIGDILTLFDSKRVLPEDQSTLRKLAEQFLLQMQCEKWLENAYLADTEKNRLLCLKIMKLILTGEGVISARDLYDAIGFGEAYQDMEEFTTRFLDQIGFKHVMMLCKVLKNTSTNQTETLTPEHASVIQLAIQEGSVQTLLDHFFATEELEKPTEEGYTHNKITLLEAPAVLPLTLKRFESHRFYKVALDNEISITLANGKKTLYTLQSVGCHLEWGHYIAGCRYEEDKQVQWLEHNDGYTSYIGPNLLHWRADPDHNAYLLVYHLSGVEEAISPITSLRNGKTHVDNRFNSSSFEETGPFIDRGQPLYENDAPKPYPKYQHPNRDSYKKVDSNSKDPGIKDSANIQKKIAGLPISTSPVLGKGIRKEKCLSLIKRELQPGEEIGDAIDTGDCFYDALSQTLRKIGIDVSAEQLRKDVVLALNNPDVAQDIERSIQADPRGIKNFEDYKKYVGYSANELKTLGDPEAPTAPYWGDPHREGSILCKKYEFRLRILSAGLIESKIDEDSKLKLYRAKKAEIDDNNDPSFSHYEKLIQERLAELYKQDVFYYLDDNTYPTNSSYSKLCTLVLYEEHYRPVLTPAQF